MASRASDGITGGPSWPPRIGGASAPDSSFPRLLLGDRKGEAFANLALLVMVLASRLAAFPATIWEQDEAYFACGVLRFDPLHNHPQPPWSPLWIGAGKLAHALGLEAAKGLQVTSLLLATVTLIPLLALWSYFLERKMAVAAAALYLATPAAWLFSGRAFSETPATALLLLCLVLWVDPADQSRRLVGGSLAAAACLLVRPQLAIAVAAATVARAVTVRRPRGWRVVVVPGAILLAVGLAPVVFLGGGPASLLRALRLHAEIHLGLLPGVSYDFARSGISRALGHPVAGATWAVLTALGVGAMFRLGRRHSAGRSVMVSTLAGLLISVYGLANPAHARYFVPILAVSSGFVLIGLATVAGRATLPLAAAAIAASGLIVLPQLAAYRSTASPPLAALAAASENASHGAKAVLTDRTLASFVEYRMLEGMNAPVVFDYQVQLGLVPRPSADETVALFDEIHSDSFSLADARQTFSCGIPLLRRLGQDRFMDVVVAPGAALRASGAVKARRRYG